VIQICRNRGWSVPHDVAMIAGSNEASLCDHPQPGLTSVELGYGRIGYEAARLLDRLMDGEPRPTRPILMPPVGLIVRASTDFFAVEDESVAAALRFISSHIREPIGVDDIAEAVGVSRRTLECRFREQMDRPIAAEVRRLRIELAKRRLAESDASIGRVAQESGFANASRMSEVFQRELGLTPRDYRGQCRVKGVA
jgi:LacI family transcriptional regulator